MTGAEDVHDLDGYVGGPSGEVDWIMRTLDSEATAWIERTLWEAGAHLVGRRTYADMVGYWPTSTEPLTALRDAMGSAERSRAAHRRAPALAGTTLGCSPPTSPR